MNPQIVELYEVEGRSPLEIAQALGITTAEVTADLTAGSTKYIAALENEEFVTRDELREFYGGVKLLGRSSFDEKVRLKALTWLIDDGRGRHDKKDNVANGMIQQINVMIGEGAKKKTELLTNLA